MPDSQANEQFRHSELTKSIIGVFYEVYNELGHGFIESVYENSLSIALREKGCEVHQQIAIPVWFRSKQVGDLLAGVWAQGYGQIYRRRVGWFYRLRWTARAILLIVVVLFVKRTLLPRLMMR